ncbi:MAG: GAF domain-containing protein [Anaerolineae bacterium]
MTGTRPVESPTTHFPPRSHICWFYETEEEHRALITPFLLQGLEQGERVVYITDAHSAETILEYLRDGGVDGEAAIARGQLLFRTAQETYLQNGRFDPDRMLALLQAETEQALAEGYTGLRITGEMTWALRGMPGTEQLPLYEARVNALLPNLPFIGLCQYDRRRFGPEALLDLLWAHPLVAFGGQVYENHHYIPLHELPSPEQGPARVQRWLEDLAERQQVEDQSRRISAALLAVTRPARQITAFLDQDTLLREIVRSVQAVTGAYNANVFLLTDAGLVLAAGHGGYEDGQPPLGYRLELGQGIIGTVAQTGRPLLVPDVCQDPRYLYYEGLPHTRCELAVPVKSGERLLGVLDVQATTPGAFDLIALEALSALADQMAVALENVRLFGELSRRLQEMSALHDNALRLAEAGSLDELLKAILRRAMALLRARGGGIYFYNPVADELEWVLGEGSGRGNVGVRLRPGEGLSGRAFQERRPLKVDDYRTWEGRSPLFEGQPVGAVVAIPLLWQEETIGVLAISREPEQPPFSEDDMRLLTLFGQQAASAIANTRARETAERRARQLAMVNEIGQALAGTLDLPTLYRLARDGVRRLVDAPVFGISFFDPEQQTITAAFMAEGDAELDVSQFPPLTHVPDAHAGRSRAIATARPEIISDLTPAYQEERAIVVGEGPYALSALYVPMVVEGRVVGLLEVQSYRRAAYTPEDAALLQTVANQIGLAIQNARLLQEARALAAFNAEIVHSLSEGILMTDAAGRITFINPAAAAMLGGAPQDWIGRFQEELVPPDQRPVIRAADRRRREGRSDRYELELLRQDEQRIPVQVSGVPRFDPTGRFVGTLAVFTDISERKRAEETFRRYAERLQVLRTLDAAILAARSPEEVARAALEYVRRLVPCNGAGVVAFDRAAHEGIVLASDADSEIRLGVGFRFPLVGGETEIEASRRGEVIFVPDIDALPSPSRAEAALLAAGVHAYIAVPLRAGGELWGWLAVAAATPGALTAEHGEILQEVAAQLAMALYQADLRAALAAQEARLAALVERLPEGVLLLDGDHRILLANPAAQEMLPVLVGAQAGDGLTHLVGRPLASFLVAPNGSAWHELVTSDRPQRVFQIAARPVSGIGPNGGWVLVIREVTQERYLQAQLEQQERLAAVGQLASGIAHDFNNLLTTVILYAQMALEHPGLPSDLSPFIQVIIGESRQATQLVQQVLDFSRRAPMEACPMDLVPFLKESVKILERTIPENIRLRLVVEEGALVVNGDLARLRQAVVNMVLNARDAMPQGGEVRLGLSRLTVGPGERPPLAGMGPGEWVCLEVADTGIGIPPEVLPHIFEPFFTTKPRGLGTGLGLAQVYGIVQQHGGHIGVETEVGKGTTFRVYLPALCAPASGPKERGEAPVPGGRGETILLVEDHPALRAAGREVLKRLGYRVLEAADGREALAVYAAERVDLVLTDVVMPGMGGAALVEALRQQSPAVKVIAVTGYGEDQEVERIRRAGVSEVIRKPFEVERLAEVIRRVLDERCARQF